MVAEKPQEESKAATSSATVETPVSKSETAKKQDETASKASTSPATETITKDQKDTAMSESTDNQGQNEQKTQAAKAVDIPSSAFSGTQPQARAAYPGASSYPSYGAQATAASTSTSSAAAFGEERRLVIGQGITMSGEIEHCDSLLVEGTIEAALKGAKMLEISESGTFYGTVEIDEAVISGRFEGDITVNGRLTLTEQGVITGSISYKELQIEAGAIIDGKLTPLKSAGAENRAPVKREKSAKEAAALAKAKEIKEQSKPANNEEGELFGQAAAE